VALALPLPAAIVAAVADSYLHGHLTQSKETDGAAAPEAAAVEADAGSGEPEGAAVAATAAAAAGQVIDEGMDEEEDEV
jgi:hypothetical protein